MNERSMNSDELRRRANSSGGGGELRRQGAALVCALGGLTFGYDLGALAGATRGLALSYALRPAWFGLTVSASLWGAVLASPLAGRLADRLGRRALLALCAELYAGAALLLALPIRLPWVLVLAMRMSSGAALAGFVVVCPLYLAEIAPRLRRGRFVGLFQLMTGSGVVLELALSAVLRGRLEAATAWKSYFGLGAAVPLLLLALLRWVPEEPHWLLRHGRAAAADEAAARLGWSAEQWPPAEECVSPVEPLLQARHRRALLLALLTAVFNQLCGVTILRVYLLDLLAGAGLEPQLTHNLGLLVMVLNVVALVFGLALVDRVGRRPLLAWGSAAMAVCLLLLVAALGRHPHFGFYVAILAAYNFSFAASQGAVGWVYISELFPFAVRGQGQGVAAWMHWVVNAGLIWLYPLLEAWRAHASFLLFAVANAVQCAVVLRWYPETRSRKLGEIAEPSRVREF